MTVCADGMSNSELIATANLEPSRLAVSSMSKIEVLASAEHRKPVVVLCMTGVNAPTPVRRISVGIKRTG